MDSLLAYVGLAPSQIWPPTVESAPFLCSVFVVLASFVFLGFVREKKSALYIASLRERREQKMQSLQTVVWAENARLSASSGPLSETTTAASTATKPAKAEFLFDVIFEEVEREPTCNVLGIPASDPWYQRAVILFKFCLREELEEVVAKTREAQEVCSDVTGPEDMQVLLEYQDGGKLAGVLDFIDRKAIRNFGTQAPLPEANDLLGLEAFDAHHLQTPTPLLCDAAVLGDARRLLSEVYTKQRNALAYIWDVFRPVLPAYSLALVLMLCARACEAPLWAHSYPKVRSAIGQVNEDAIEGEFGFGPAIMAEVEVNTLIFLVGFLLSRPLEILSTSVGDHAAKHFAIPLRKVVMECIMKQDTEYFDFNSSAKLQERLNRDTDELVENLFFVPTRILENIFRVAQRCITLYWVTPKLLLACMCFNVPMFAIITLSTTKPLQNLLGKRDRGSRNSAAETLEILQNIKAVRQFSMEKKEKQKYVIGNVNRNVFESRIRVLESLIHELGHVAHIFGEIYVTYVALTLVTRGEAKVAEAVVGNIVGMWLQHDLKNLLQYGPKLVKVIKPLRRVASLLASKPRIEQDPKNPLPNTKLRPPSFTGRIEFRDVVFSYPTERQKKILNGLSFTAEPGQKVAFVGKAGCGKSTAMDLLQRFYNRTGGEILIDGNPIEKYNTDVLRGSCGIVSQTSVLFSRSIYENVVYGVDDPPAPDSERFMEVCKKAQAWEFIQSFPNKQYTLVGEKGVRLSGGQRQRINIARVIMRQPTFLFLDEATSALDAINEKAVQEALDDMLKKHHGVAIVVAHRLTTICNCDKIIVLGDDGTKVEEGTHEELLQVEIKLDADGNPVPGPGLYHTLWDTQQVKGNSQAKAASSQKKLQDKEAEINRLRKELTWMQQTYYTPSSSRRPSCDSNCSSFPSCSMDIGCSLGRGGGASKDDLSLFLSKRPPKEMDRLVRSLWSSPRSTPQSTV